MLLYRESSIPFSRHHVRGHRFPVDVHTGREPGFTQRTPKNAGAASTQRAAAPAPLNAGASLAPGLSSRDNASQPFAARKSPPGAAAVAYASANDRGGQSTPRPTDLPSRLRRAPILLTSNLFGDGRTAKGDLSAAIATSEAATSFLYVLCENEWVLAKQLPLKQASMQYAVDETAGDADDEVLTVAHRDVVALVRPASSLWTGIASAEVR